MRSRNAFTLIELLVVLTIIAIAAALLFPVFSRSIKSAHQTTCASNFHQQHIFVSSYQSDYDEMMPIVYYGDGTWNSPPSRIYSQDVKGMNTALFHCPSDPADDQARMTAYMPAVGTNKNQADFNLGLKNNFGFNWQYLSPVGTREAGSAYTGIPISKAAILQPTETILAADSTFGNDDAGQPLGGGSGAVDPPCRYYSDHQDSFPAPTSFYYRSWWGGWHPDHPEWGGPLWFCLSPTWRQSQRHLLRRALKSSYHERAGGRLRCQRGMGWRHYR